MRILIITKVKYRNNNNKNHMLPLVLAPLIVHSCISSKSCLSWILISHISYIIPQIPHIMHHPPPTSLTYAYIFALQMRTWLLPTSFTLVYGPMIGKTWRVNRIFKLAGAKRVVSKCVEYFF